MKTRRKAMNVEKKLMETFLLAYNTRLSHLKMTDEMCTSMHVEWHGSGKMIER